MFAEGLCEVVFISVSPTVDGSQLVTSLETYRVVLAQRQNNLLLGKGTVAKTYIIHQEKGISKIILFSLSVYFPFFHRYTFQTDSLFLWNYICSTLGLPFPYA